ncbi:MAG: CRISPR-associated endonuclease Cas2 [Pyrinomonadaceae bacterium]
MYVLIVYDIGVERVTKVHKLLKGYLNWRQNSVFEGELTEAQIEKLKYGLKSIVNLDTDSVLIYIARDEKWLKREEIGNQRGTTANII